MRRLTGLSKLSTLELLSPDWPAPENVVALSTTRHGGVSEAPWTGLNLGVHVGDDIQKVRQNRAALRAAADLPSTPIWLEQVHGIQVVDASVSGSGNREADASYSQQPNVVCVVMTADCLPLLVCDRQGSFVAAIHAGWRGLQAGVIASTLTRYQGSMDDLLVWLGPAIGSDAFEVGAEVREAFCRQDSEAQTAFKPGSTPEKWLADLYQLARQNLRRLGVQSVYGGELCTYSDEQRFYSYRRDGQTGRMASLIWLK